MFCVIFSLMFVESRSKYDTEQQLKINREEQRKLNEAAMHADLDLKQKKIDQKITVCKN